MHIEFKVDERTFIAETSKDGKMRRIMRAVPLQRKDAPVVIQNVAIHLAESHGWCFRASWETGKYSLILRHMRGELKRLYDESLFGDDIVILGFLDARPMSEFVRESDCEVTESNDSVVLECRHAQNGMSTFRFDAKGMLQSLQVRKKIGEAYSHFSPPLRLPRQIDYTFEHEETAPDDGWTLKKFLFVESRADGPMQRVAIIDATPFDDELGETIEFPDRRIPNGTRVQMELNGEIQDDWYEFRDGHVEKVDDEMP